METLTQLNSAWLDDLTNPHHDGTTQQIYDFVAAFQTDNARFQAKVTALGQARQTEDAVWITSQRDPSVKNLEGADKQQDGYVAAGRFTILAHTFLPDGEPTKAEALECEQIFKDCNFQTRDPYGAESDKIIQMQQNFQQHQAFLTQIGAWTFLTKAVAAAQQVRLFLGQRALTLGEAVKGEMKTARRATDHAIADLYKTIEAMMELMPSAELTTLYNQLKGIELYARQYYLKEGSTGSGAGSSGGSQSGQNNQGGQSGQNTQTGDNTGDNTGNNGQQTGDNTGDNTGNNDNPGGNNDNPGGDNGNDNPGGDINDGGLDD